MSAIDIKITDPHPMKNMTTRQLLIKSRELFKGYINELKTYDRDELWSLFQISLKGAFSISYGVGFEEFIGTNISDWESLGPERKKLIRNKFGGDDTHIRDTVFRGMNGSGYLLLSICQNNRTYEDIIMYVYRKIDANSTSCEEFIRQMEIVMSKLDELLVKYR